MIRLNKKGIAEVVELFFVILIIVFFIIAIIFAVFFTPVPFEQEVENDFFQVNDAYTLNSLLRMEVYQHGAAISIADFIRKYDITGSYKNELLCILYKQSKTPQGWYTSYEIKIQKDGKTMSHKSPFDQDDIKGAMNHGEPLLGAKQLTITAIPSNNGPIVIDYKTGPKFGSNYNYMPRSYWAHLGTGEDACEFVTVNPDDSTDIEENLPDVPSELGPIPEQI